MIQYSDFIYFDGTNDPVVNAAITVMIANTQTPATLFSDVGGTIPLTNPVTSDQTGFFSFYVTQGTYDLYLLGAKQFQISVNGTTGIPDPLTIGTLNVHYVNPTNGVNVVIGSSVDDTVNKLQVEGTLIVKPVGFTIPWPPQKVYPIKAVGTSAAGSTVSSSCFSDGLNTGGRLYLSRNMANGNKPTTGSNLGNIAFGTIATDGTGNLLQSATIQATAEEDSGVTGFQGTSMRFGTTPIGTLPTIERMRITPAGNVLIGTTTDDTVNKLQVNGTISALGIKLTDPSPVADKNTLEYFEQGTWTPVGRNSTVIPGSFAALDPIVCNYQRIGKRVTVSVSVQVTAGTSGFFGIDGLPFPINNFCSPVTAPCVGGNGGSYLFRGDGNTTPTLLAVTPPNDIFAGITGTQAATEQYFFGTFTYITN